MGRGTSGVRRVRSVVVAAASRAQPRHGAASECRGRLGSNGRWREARLEPKNRERQCLGAPNFCFPAGTTHNDAHAAPPHAPPRRAAMDQEYDAIILGTGLKECLLAGLLSVEGYKVCSTAVSPPRA